MTQAWANFVISGDANCNCCGNVAPPACFLSLPPPIGDGGYANLATANGVINNQTDNCLAFANIDYGNGGFINSFAATEPAGNTVWINFTGRYDNGIGDIGSVWLGGNVATANTYVNFAYSSAADIYATTLFYSNGISWGSLSGSSNSALLATTDNYAIRMTATNIFGSGGPINVDVNVFSPNAVSYCSIRANYDSGGGVYAWLNC